MAGGDLYLILDQVSTTSGGRRSAGVRRGGEEGLAAAAGFGGEAAGVGGAEAFRGGLGKGPGGDAVVAGVEVEEGFESGARGVDPFHAADLGERPEGGVARCRSWGSRAPAEAPGMARIAPPVLIAAVKTHVSA